MRDLAVAIEEKRFPGTGAAAPKLALRKVAFRVAPDEFVAIVGPSGCGKTTLLNIVAGLDRDYTGRVEFGANAEAPRIGYVFQNVRLLPWRTVRENLALVLPAHGDPGAIDAVLREVGLFDARDVFASRLSVGMSRRAGIARALAVEPTLMLMDEPFVSLDEPMAERLRQLVVDVLRRRPTSVLFVTHDLREAASLADRVLLLSPAPGQLIAEVPIAVPRDRRDAASIDAARDTIRRRQDAWRPEP